MEPSNNYNNNINEDVSMIGSTNDLLDTPNDNNEIVTLMSMIRRGELSTHTSEEILEIDMEYGEQLRLEDDDGDDLYEGSSAPAADLNMSGRVSFSSNTTGDFGKISYKQKPKSSKKTP
ncbi:hypothetical protein [Parasitella parasitica]|uniref:Uncharacterized protein n=1 Tax=Parasitella parasitica TaxID=35722 RepID=A0A0B7MW16_9FUNG|nr:hypothetical protein [Parasitella parasitica]